MRWIIQSPAENERGPAFIESVLLLLHRAFAGREQLLLNLETHQGEVGLSVECPDEVRALFQAAILDAYPGLVLAASPVKAVAIGNHKHWSQNLYLIPDIVRLRAFQDTASLGDASTVDPMAVLLSALRTGRSGNIECRVTVSLRPATATRHAHTARVATRAYESFRNEAWRHRYLTLATHPAWYWRLYALAWSMVMWRRDVARDLAPDAKVRCPLWECDIEVAVMAPPDAAEIATRKLREIVGAFAQFQTNEASFVSGRVRTTRSRVRRMNRGSLLTATELATLWHPLTERSHGVARVPVALFREVEPPLLLPSKEREQGVLTLGRVQYRNQRDQFGIRQDDLRRHLIAVGKTGCGKSTFLAGIVRQAMEKGYGCILIDPHGQLADDVLDYVPKRRTNDVILFDASDREYLVGFNPLIGPPGSDPTLVADGVLTSFQHVFGFDETSAPRLLHIFRNGLLSLIGRSDASLLAVQRLLVDAIYRKSVVAGVRNPVVREFWHSEFSRWNERDRTQFIASLQNKLGAFTTNERLQRIFGASENGIELRSILDRSQILICNLSKGTVGHEASTLLGSLLLSSLQVAAMSRADVLESERPDTIIVVDEFHSYLSERNPTFASALAESRKYRTSYVLSTQLLEQLDEKTLAAVLGNCGSGLTMTVGPRDAAVLAELLGSGLLPEDLMRIPKFHGYLRMLVDGAPHTFSMTTMTAPKARSGRGEMIRRVSRERYGVVRSAGV